MFRSRRMGTTFTGPWLCAAQPTSVCHATEAGSNIRRDGSRQARLHDLNDVKNWDDVKKV
jgi:hypothetical protein